MRIYIITHQDGQKEAFEAQNLFELKKQLRDKNIIPLKIDRGKYIYLSKKDITYAPNVVKSYLSTF